MRRKMTGIETGDCSAFDIGATLRYASDVEKRTGNYALRFSSTNTRVGWQIPDGPKELYGRIGFRLTGGVGGAARVFMFLVDSSGAQHLTFAYNASTLLLEVHRGNYAGDLLGQGTGIDLNTWYCLEWRALIDDANGVVQVKKDGVLDLDLSEVDTRNGGNGDISVVYYGSDPASGNAIALGYYDDLVINDTLGEVNNSWPGRGGLYPAVPVGPGAYAEFTPLAGANWENVAEIPPDDDTSYVESNVYEHQDLYVTGGIAPPDGTITAVQLCHRAKLADVGIGNLRPLVRHGGVDYVGPDKAVDASYRGIRHIMERAPDDSAWSVAKVNKLQIGQQVG